MSRERNANYPSVSPNPAPIFWISFVLRIFSLDSQKQRKHRFEEVRSKMVDQWAHPAERRVPPRLTFLVFGGFVRW
jgi:hypothetical protein